MSRSALQSYIAAGTRTNRQQICCFSKTCFSDSDLVRRDLILKSFQTHLSENKREVDWVRQLEPDCQHYTEVLQLLMKYINAEVLKRYWGKAHTRSNCYILFRCTKRVVFWAPKRFLHIVSILLMKKLRWNKGSCHLRFSGFCPLRGYPPPYPLNGKSV